MKKLLCEKCMTEASMLKTAKQGVADLRVMTPGAAGSNTQMPCLSNITFKKLYLTKTSERLPKKS